MTGSDVAIIGVSGIYPDAEDLGQFLVNLAAGVDSVREISPQRRIFAGLDEAAHCYPIASVESIDKFDHEFFGISLKEAEYMDPQQRFLLQLACAAIEDAGYSLSHFRSSRTATIVSASNNDYSKLYSIYDPSMVTGQLPGALAGRIAYSLDLRGPAMVIDTACSSSLLAVYEAYRKVAAGQVDYALAGGINLYFINDYDGNGGGDAGSVGINSPDGRCKTFDASANGAGWGEGGGLVLLKSLSKALADRDHIYAIIKGGGVNQDGGRSNGLAAPSPHAQADVIVEAWREADISPSTISYLEAHGTGTELGDPVEIQGITDAFKQFTPAKQFCAISALKTNIGHLAGAAGIAGLTKVILSLQHRKLFPSLHFQQPNPFIDFKNSPVFVNTQLRDWDVPKPAGVRRAGISSFGLSGTNVHLVVEEAPPAPAATEDRNAPTLITLSAKTPEALQRYFAKLVAFLESTDQRLSDIAYTLNHGRNDYQYRFAGVVNSRDELRNLLKQQLAQPVRYSKPDKVEPSLVFLLPGESQVTNDFIGQLEDQYPTFKQSWAQCQVISTSAVSHPGIRMVAFYYSLYQTWLSLGLGSQKIIGTGIGNIAVAVITGRLELADGLEQATSYQNGAVRPDTAKLKAVLDQIRTVKPLFLEFGHNSELAKEIVTLETESLVVPSLNGNHELLTIVAELYVKGARIDWTKFYEKSEYHRVSLPTYSFEATSCWIPEIAAGQALKVKAAQQSGAAPIATEIYGELETEGSESEHKLAAIWGEVLKVKRLDRDDDFFDLGGNSLDGTQVISRIEESLGVRIEFETLYDYPTVSELGRHIDSLKGAESSYEEPVPDPAPAGVIEKSAGQVMSSGQERLWFLDQLEPGSTFYNLPYAISIKGELSVAALERSLSEVMRRHEVLRGTFSNLDGRVVSLIDWSRSLYLAVVDLREFPREQNRRTAEELTRVEARRPFDLEHGPLIRVSLLRLTDDEYILLLTLHHIVADRWSIQILIRELSALYEVYVRGHASPLPVLPIQYADYAQWQREWLQSDAYAEHLAYWTRQLDGVPHVLGLPTDNPRPAIPSFKSKHVSFTLSAELTTGLKELSRSEGVTLFMVLVAGFQTLLQRYTQQTEVNIGTPVAGRTRRETEVLIGFFVNTLVLRTDFSGEPSFVELLKRVREVCLGAYAHQEVPFEKLVEELEVERSLSHTPLFQVMLALQNMALPTVSLGDLELEVMETEHGTTQFDLVLFLTEAEEELVGRLEYSEDLFEEETVQRMVGQFERLLAAVVKEPEERVSRLKLLSTAEREELVEKWNDTAVSYGPERTVVSEFERQAAERGEEIAVVCGGEEVSYAELNRRANQIGRYLQGKGVGAETIVGVCLERSVEMVAVLLGILKAGGAYLPLDPEYPAERLRYMVADAGVQLVLSEELQISDFRFQIDAQRENNLKAVEWVAIAEEREAISGERTENLETEIDEANLAYVIYTSGSTGQPKGVLIEHGNLSNFLATMAERPGLTASDVLVGVTTLSFDIAGLELWLPLWTGGRLVLAERWQTRDAEALLELLAQQEATVMQATPVTWRMMLESGWQESQELKVLCGGEGMSRELGQALVKRGGAVWNMYGPTETTIWSMTQELRAGAEAEWGTGPVVTIGKPIGNTQVYVLDEEGEVVPVGVVGELYIGGEGVGRGYQGRAEQTAERFVPDGVSGRRGGRLYRTGDQVRYRRNGVLEYLGRADEQVKVRGYRIELGEIEGRLREHEGVKECVVVRVGTGEQGRLVGYVEVSAGVGEGIMEELRRHLEERLPGYMVPDLLMKVAELPLTANGKVNRRALPAPEWRVEGVEWEGTRTASEEVVAGVWSRVLGVTGLGRGANFFTVGGHSLLATQVMARLREIFAVELPLRTIFEHPTIASLAAHIDQKTTSENQQLLQPIQAVVRDGPRVLSFAQQRLSFIDQITPGNIGYNISLAVSLSGSLNVAALVRSIESIVQRHEVLRSIFPIIDGRSIQLINESESFDLPLVDLTDTPLESRRQVAFQFATDESRRAFDLAHGPLLRATLLRLSDEDHVLLLTVHHIVSDGWSTGVLIHELTTFYKAYATDSVPVLEALPIQYADYAEWQREWLQGEQLEEQLGYWRKQLSGATSILELPTDHPRPANRTYQGGRLHFTFSKELTTGLKELSRSEGATLFMVLVAGFQTLLQRYTQQIEVSIGTPVAGRTRRETEGLIGFFVNTLVLRTNFSGEPSFLELLKQVREVCLSAYAHQEVPFEKLVEELEVERSLSHTPLFQVMLALQNMALPVVSLGELELEVMETEHGTTQFDLVLFLTEAEEELVGRLEYSEDLFEEETVQRMVGQFERLLEAVVKEPEERVIRLKLLSTAEREELVEKWNDTAVSFGPERTVVSEFEQQVEARGEAIAVVCGGEEVSYAELNRRANQIGRYLQGKGVGAETIVGVCLERSVEMVAVLLGILKAGGAYLPLDPEYPAERLRYMVADAGVQLVLSEELQISDFRFQIDAQRQNNLKAVEWVAIREAGISAERDENLETEIDGANLAYVIYTSGSTGQPKGVLIEHRGFVNFALTMKERLGFEPGQRILKFASLSFDASVVQIFPALLGGAAVAIDPSVTKLSNDELLSLSDRLKLTHLDLPAAFWRQWVDDMTRRNVTLGGSLRVFMTGGEKLPVESLVKWSRLVQRPMVFVNSYGPTETTVAATVHITSSIEASGLEGSHVTIGRPIANVQIYLLDHNLQPVPLGVAGELYIGGAGIGRGYHNRPDLTAEKFIPNPYSKKPGELLYRTGDLARYLPNGDVDFLGRKDEQVKIRGFRVELGEIEALLRKHPAVREVVVAAREYQGGDKRLVAYCVPSPEGSFSDSTMKSYLKENLPDYMVPSIFVRLDAMPLTGSAKIDRKALLERELDYQETEAFVPARTPTEEILAGQWAELLDLPQVGANDDFFDLGGHSLLATQVISRLREVFQVELPLRSLFETPTVASIAALIDQTSMTEAAPILPAPVGAELPLSFAQQRFWFLDQLNAGNAAFNIPAAVLLNGTLDRNALQQSFEEIVKRHGALRTIFKVVNDRPVQVVKPAQPLSIPVVDLTGLNAETQQVESQRLAAAESVQSFDLSGGPLLSIMLLQLAETRHLLTVTIHHIAFDGWSLGVLLDEFSHFYTNLVLDKEVEPPPLPIQYGDYAFWQRQELQGELWDDHLNYWKRQLEHAPTMLELPTDRPRAMAQSFRGARLPFALSASLTEALKSLSRREGATLFMTAFATFATLLNRFTGQEDLIVGADIANRTRLETEPMIGCFFNHLALRTDLSGQPTFRELLRRVRQTILGAYAHQDFPFDALVQAIQPERVINSTPLFQVLLVFLNVPIKSIELPDLTLIQQPIETGLAKFDLTLFLGMGSVGLEGVLEYNTDLFDESTAIRMVQNFETLLEAIVDHPDQQLEQLTIGSEDEVLVAGFNEVLE
ncbi:MAG TPA: amino acid adenylation domain-containing protein [Pyrinomonadaceae bacterium]